MVQVGNMNIDIGGMFGSTMGVLLNVAMIGTGFLLVFGLIGWIIWVYYNKKIYSYPVTLINRRENGSTKTITGLKGGLVKGKGGVQTFKIKIPKKWKKKDIGYVPDMTLADSENRVYFISIGDGATWQQLDYSIQFEKDVPDPVTQVEIEEAAKFISGEIERLYKDKPLEFKEQLFDNSLNNFYNEKQTRTRKIKLIATPIPTDLKSITLNAIHDVQKLTEKNKMTAMAIGIGAFLIMAVVQIIFLYFTRNR